MIIKSLTMENFRQYKGKQSVAFSSDPDRNVTIIIGNNTSGKTTLVQAFLWCLYEKVSFDSKGLLNVEIRDRMGSGQTSRVSVSVLLIHSEREYCIRREQNYTRDYGGRIIPGKPVLSVSYKDETGNSVPLPFEEQEKMINKILPQDLSDYFFFDGERIEKISDKKNVGNAVRGLMGLDIIQKVMVHLDPSKSNSVIGQLRKSLDTGSDTNSAELKAKLENVQKNLVEHERQLENLKEELEIQNGERERLSSKLRDTQEVRGKQEQREKDLKSQSQAKEYLKDGKARFYDDFRDGALAFFARPLIQRAEKVLESSPTDLKGIPEMHYDSLEYVINRGICVCGCDLTNNPEAVKHIRYEQSLLPPQHIGTSIRNLLEKCGDWKERGEGYAKRIQDDFEQIRRAERRIGELEENLQNISEQIQTMGSVNTAKLESDYRAADRSVMEINKKIGELGNRISLCRGDIIRYEKKIDGLAVKTRKNKLIRTEIAYAEALYNRFSESYGKRQKEVLVNLNESINGIFSRIYHGRRRAEVDENYRIQLYIDDGGRTKTDESKGLEAVKNFSFICGLVDLAKREAKERDKKEEDVETLYVSEPYPIVMDAPFSNVDEIHISNIAAILPASAEQVILIVMNKDWNYAKVSMESKVGARYLIEKVDNSDTYSVIKEGQENAV